MRILKHIRNQVILVGLLCTAGYVAYQVFLDDEAKDGLRSLGTTMAGSYTQLSNLVNDRIGTIMDEDLVAQNRQNIKDAWANLGY